MSKQAFQEEFEKILATEINSSKNSKVEDLLDTDFEEFKPDNFGLPLKNVSNKNGLAQDLDYEKLKKNIKKKDYEILEKIKFRRESQKREEAQKQEIRQRSDLKVTQNKKDPFQENQELADFFKHQEAVKAKQRNKKGLLTSMIFLFIAILFFSFSFFSLYVSSDQRVTDYHQLCLADLEYLKPETIQRLNLQCEKARIFRVMLDTDLASKNYRNNREVIKNLDPADLLSQDWQKEEKIKSLLEILKIAEVTNLPKLDSRENKEELLTKLQEILTETEVEVYKDKTALENLVFGIDTIEIQEYQNFYESIKNTTGQSLVLQRPKLKSTLENLQNLVLEQKGERFLDNIQTFKFINPSRVRLVLSLAEFKNLEDYTPAVFTEEASNQRILNLAQIEGYPVLGVVNLSTLNSENLQSETSLAWQELLRNLIQENILTLEKFETYLSPKTLDSQFLATFKQLTAKDLEQEILESQIQEAMVDDFLLESLKQSLPGGLNPSSTGYAITLNNLTSEQMVWLTENNYLNLKQNGFIPFLENPNSGFDDNAEIKITKTTETNNLLKIIFIPNLKEIFTDLKVNLD